MKRTITFAAIALVATNAYGQATTAVVQNSTMVSPGDEYFAMRAYAEGIAEVALNQLAAQRASNPDIRRHAEQMVRDHIECDNKIVEMARRKGIALPAGIDAVSNAALNRLATLSGSDFDRAYLKALICSHKAALHLFHHQSAKGEDVDLKDFADKSLPMLQSHTEMAYDLAGERAEYKKLCKIQEYAKQVMAEK